MEAYMAGPDFEAWDILELSRNLKIYFDHVETQTETFEKIRIVVIQRIEELLRSDNPKGSVREIWQLLESACDTAKAQYYVVRHTSRFRDRFQVFLSN
jgi:hypothetical protein